MMAMHTRSFNQHLLKIVILLVLCSSCRLLGEKTTEGECSMTRTSSPTCIVTDTLPQHLNSGALNYKAMPSIGNGYVGTVVMSDEIHISGVFNGRANVIPVGSGKENWKKAKRRSKRISSGGYIEHTHRARIPSTVALNFSLGAEGKRLFALDVQKGVFYQWFDSNDISIEQRIYAHRTMKNILINEFIIQTGTSFTLAISSNRGAESKDINFRSYTKVNESQFSYMAMLGEINETESDTSEIVSVAVVWTKVPKHLEVQANTQTQRFVYITSIVTSLETDIPLEMAKKCYEITINESLLFDKHAKGWRDIWKSGNITVHNNIYLAQTISTSFYNIISSVRSDWMFGLSPGSLSASHEYLGHTFWDQDIWMFPPMLMFYTDIAHSLIQYRYDRLKEAQRIAEKYHFKGAMYPWESALSGIEVCPYEVYGRNEIHVSGDIAFAAHQYFKSTKDIVWLRKYGFPIIYQTALFWLSRVVYNVTKGAYVINDVMPPDEYHYPVNNSVYTNILARLNLKIAVLYGRILNEPVPDEWAQIADKLFIPYDKKLKYHPEYEGFNITDTKSQVKQADTILIYYPLMQDFHDDQITMENDLQYYGNVTDANGPAMTQSMFTIGWLQLSNKKSAHASFIRNFENIQEPFKVWSEIKGGEGAANFITAAGGYLQAVIFGYGGFRINDDKLSFNLNLLNDCKEMGWNGIKYLDNSITFDRKLTICTVKLLMKSKVNSLCVSNRTGANIQTLTEDDLQIDCEGFVQLCH